jgi:hypothetical protein
MELFVEKALLMKTDNSNYEIVNRILDAIDAIRLGT